MIGFRYAARCAAVATLGYLLIGGASRAATFTNLYSFPDLTAANPGGGLYRDANGALYGATLSGGLPGTGCPADGCGVVFKLAPPSGGNPNWTRKILHKFGADEPYYVYSSLVADKNGNLYGVGQYGGINDQGAVFQLTPPSAGNTTWGFKVIHHLAPARGINPFCDLFIDSKGRIYLTTYSAGPDTGAGTVLRLNPPLPGKTNWTPTILHTFQGADGNGPSGGVIEGPDGSLYGTTWSGGANGFGVIYRLTPPASGVGPWTFRKLYDFAGAGKGRNPEGSLVLYNGFLYGTTYNGGVTTANCTDGCGTIFRLKLPSTPSGPVTFAVLHRMAEASEGSNPWTGLTLGPGGVLFGTNYLQGPGGQGTLFKLKPPSNGNGWTLVVLHSFGGMPDGDDSTAPLLRGSDGKFYGATQYGGANDHGMVFSYQP